MLIGYQYVCYTVILKTLIRTGNIYTFRDKQCSSTDCLLMHRCQLCMFRTVTVHPQLEQGCWMISYLQMPYQM